MPQENVETVRRLYEIGAIDHQADALRAALDPDAVWINPPDAVEPGTRHGAAEVVAAVENLAHSFDAAEHVLHDLFEAGDIVVASVTFYARGRDSGAELTQDEAHTWIFRDGRVISFEWGRDLPAALEAAGFTEQPPSPQNIGTLQRLAQAFGRRDLDRAMAHFADDVEVRPAVVGIDVGTFYNGRGELRGFWEQITEAWAAQTVELKEMIEAPGERVVAVEQWHVRGRDGIELDFELIDVYTFRDGLIVRIDGFRERAEALEAVGLSE